MNSTPAPSRDDIDCADCANYPNLNPAACRACTSESERTGAWLPMFIKRTTVESIETTENEAVTVGFPRGVIVGVTGVARAGKDTIAAYLEQRYGFTRESFAEPIRAFVRTILDMSKAELESDKEKPIGWLPGTPRRLMQTIGTEWGRGVDEALWIKSALRRAGPALAVGRNVVISDVRFDNEAEAIKAAGGVIVQVLRPGAGTAEAHVSEAGIRNSLVDIVLCNDGDISWLTAQVDRYVASRLFAPA